MARRRTAWAAAVLLAAALPALAGEPVPPATDRERLRRADEALDRVRGAAREVDRLLADARAARDVLRATCLRERQARAAGIAAAAERAATALREAVAARLEGADVELSALALAVRQADEVGTEAASCLGALPYAGDGTRATALPSK